MSPEHKPAAVKVYSKKHNCERSNVVIIFKCNVRYKAYLEPFAPSFCPNKFKKLSAQKLLKVLPTKGVGLEAPKRNIFLYCSKVKNFVALLGVSAIIGGKIPL